MHGKLPQRFGYAPWRPWDQGRCKPALRFKDKSQPTEGASTRSGVWWENQLQGAVKRHVVGGAQALAN
jgi:hypothetical protein